jgi:predicted thioesterase
MAFDKIKPGLKGEAACLVGKDDLASAYGNPGVEVLSSMTLMTLLEQACLNALQNSLGPKDMSVGARMEMDHLAPTPAGFKVTAQAELAEVSGRKLVFKISAADEMEQVARAVHVRYLVDRPGFLAKAALKADRRTQR